MQWVGLAMRLSARVAKSVAVFYTNVVHNRRITAYGDSEQSVRSPHKATRLCGSEECAPYGVTQH